MLPANAGDGAKLEWEENGLSECMLGQRAKGPAVDVSTRRLETQAGHGERASHYKCSHDGLVPDRTAGHRKESSAGDTQEMDISRGREGQSQVLRKKWVGRFYIWWNLVSLGVGENTNHLLFWKEG